jgi:hypothetical protein
MSGPLGNFVSLGASAEGDSPRHARHFNVAQLISVEYRGGQGGGGAARTTLELTFVGGLTVTLEGGEAELVYAQLNPPQDHTATVGTSLGGGQP